MSQLMQQVLDQPIRATVHAYWDMIFQVAQQIYEALTKSDLIILLHFQNESQGEQS